MRAVFPASLEDETQSVQPLGRQYLSGPPPHSQLLYTGKPYAILYAAGRNKRSFLLPSGLQSSPKQAACPTGSAEPNKAGGNQSRSPLMRPKMIRLESRALTVLLQYCSCCITDLGGWTRSFWNLLPFLLLLA